MKERIPVGILISGRGSNMSALLQACGEAGYPCRPAIVVSSRPQAAGLEIARKAGVATRVVDHLEYPDRESFETRLNGELRDAGAHLLCSAGFMRILTAKFTAQWRNRLLNIHPSLLPAFPGTHVHERVLESGVKLTGCTVHYVREEPDAGPIIAQAATVVRHDDNVESLAARVLQLEHRLYPHALRLVADGRAPVHDGRVRIEEQPETIPSTLFFPPIRRSRLPGRRK